MKNETQEALNNLTDTAKLIERVEGERKNEDTGHAGNDTCARHWNGALDAVIEMMKGDL